MSISCLSPLLTASLLIFGLSSHLYAQDVNVWSNDGLLSVQASNTSAADLAKALSDQLGIVVVITGDTETLVNIDIIDEPIEKAINKLSPNNMLVRAGDEITGDIIEVVLIMGESTAGVNASSGRDEFLPSGSPAEAIEAEEEDLVNQAADGAGLRDPNRANAARDAANAASTDAGLAGTSPRDEGQEVAFDRVTGLPIDPVTGLPLTPQ